MRLRVATLATVLLAGCTIPLATATPKPTSPTASTPTVVTSAPTTPEPVSPTVAAFWANYPPDLKRIIDEDTVAAMCAELQGIFDVWDKAKDLGGKSDLLAYVDNALRKAGCYS